MYLSVTAELSELQAREKPINIGVDDSTSDLSEETDLRL